MGTNRICMLQKKLNKCGSSRIDVCGRDKHTVNGARHLAILPERAGGVEKALVHLWLRRRWQTSNHL